MQFFKVFKNSKQMLTNERGNILIIFASVMIVIFVLFAGMVDFGRYLIIREKMQTAADAAALASSTSEVKRMVNITVTTDRGNAHHCNKYRCWCSGCGTVEHTVEGEEVQLIDNEGWRVYIAPYCSCGGGSANYVINKRWVVYDNKTGSGDTADKYFQANMTASGLTGKITKLITYDDPNHPAYPSVDVYATTEINSLFKDLWKVFPAKYTTDVCAQASTYYHKNVNDSDSWQKPPEDYCWVDW